MPRKALWRVALLALLLCASLEAASPWGSLKKIYFYEASGNLGEVRRNLERLDAQGLPPGEKIDLMNKLTELGDRYFMKKNDSLAEAFYRQTLKISPQDAWPVYNKLEKISRRRGGLLWNLTGVARQFTLLTSSFNGSILLLGGFFSVLMFAGLLLFFMVAAALAVRYFKLAAHDFILEGSSRFSLIKLLLLLLFLFWPLLVTGGWAIYPFLLCGFLWNYLNHDERVNVKRIQVLLLLLAFLYSLGQYLEKSMQSPGFQIVQQVYSGQLFPASAYSGFDNEMKVMQAYAYYHRDQPDIAMDVLLETGSAYATTLKFNLLGDIHFEKGNIPQSIQYYRQSLSMDDRNPVTLMNFTVALLKNNDPDLFLFYSKNYPQINQIKDKITALQKNRLPEKILWQRLLNFSWVRFHFWHLLEVMVGEFIRFPVLLAILIMAAYVWLLKRFFPSLGQSIFCSKCGKIIRKMSIEQAQSHALCEECYQLFLIKDPIFLEAKLLKEKEIVRQSLLKNSLLLATSLVVPGFLLNFRDKGKVFAPLFFVWTVVFGLFLVNALNFKGVFGTVPMFLNLIGLAAVVLYLAVAIYSLQGNPDGF
jgi:tetratricopeptide (TPR) repeat protein